MKQSTIDRIINNHNNRKLTHIGAYIYDIQWHPLDNKWYIRRCKKDNIGREWLDWKGNVISGWEWIQPIDFENKTQKTT